MSRPTDGPGACRMVHAQMHLENHCNKPGRSSKEQRANDRERIKFMKKNLL